VGDIEIERDVLLNSLFDAIQADVEFVFGDATSSIEINGGMLVDRIDRPTSPLGCVARLPPKGFL
jgi:hypothetical protein